MANATEETLRALVGPAASFEVFQQTVAGTAAALGDPGDFAQGIWVTNLHATKSIFFGPDNTVLATTGAAIPAGKRVRLPGKNPAAIFVVTDGTSITYTYDAWGEG